ALELGQRRNEPRQRAGIADAAIGYRLIERPIIFRCVAMEEIFEHVGDRGAAGMRTIDIVVIDAVFGEASRERLTVARCRGRAEARDEAGEFDWRHAAFRSSLRLIRHSAICTAFNAAPLRRLSDTIQSDRPCSTVGSLRIRLTKV